jgi:hypothetical protein
METEEGSPAWTAVGSPQSTSRTTEHTTTHRAYAHRITPSDAVIWTAFTLGVGIILIIACVLLTLGAPS